MALASWAKDASDVGLPHACCRPVLLSAPRGRSPLPCTPLRFPLLPGAPISPPLLPSALLRSKCVECLNSLDMDHLELMRHGEAGDLASGSGGAGPAGDGLSPPQQEGSPFTQELRDMGIRTTPPPVASAAVYA